jgi:preprotein translocase subunit SecE
MKFIKKYIGQVIAELKKVTWPNKEQTINKTVLVLIVSAVIALFIAGVDFILQNIMRTLIN